MRDYLYIPLGGNRVSLKRMYFNLAFVFVVSGFWHGAAWNFIIWGAFHGLFLILDRLFLLKFYEKIGKYPSIIITFFLTIIGWVIFRAVSLDQVLYYTKALFKFDFSDYHVDPQFWYILIIAILFSFSTIFIRGLRIEKFMYFSESYSNKQVLGVGLLMFILLLLSVLSIVSSGFNPFIYFRF